MAKKTPVKELRDLYKQYKRLPVTNTRQLVECYVCQKKLIRSTATYIGNGIYRHANCCAGSISWLKHRKSSPNYDIFTKTYIQNSLKGD